jgi:predicted dehydrogenase
LEVWTDVQGLAVLEDLPTETGELLNVPGFRLSGHETIEVSQIETYGNYGPWRARGESRDVSTRVRVRASLGGEAAKPYVYRESVRAGMVDLASAILEDRLPCVAGLDVWASLASAVAAREAARSAQPVVPARLPTDLSG